MSVHEDQAQAMRDKIHQLNLLKNAQEPDSHNWWRYQDQITELTKALIAHEANIPRLHEIDAELARARHRVSAAEWAVSRSDALPRAAIGLGLVGVAGLVLGLHVWGPAILAGLVALAAAAAVVLRLSHRRRVDEAEVRAARTAAADVEARRHELLPDAIEDIIAAAVALRT